MDAGLTPADVWLIPDSVWLKYAPAKPSERDAVVISGGGHIVMDSAFVALSGKGEVRDAFTVKLNVPSAAGVPEITPEEESSRPGGRLPEAMLHVIGPLPEMKPDAASV
jgi:hypothetical protein